MMASPQRRKAVSNLGNLDAGSYSAAGLATDTLKRRALLLILAMAFFTLAIVPIARVQWHSVPALLSAYHTLLIAAYCISAYIIYGFYQAKRLLGLLYLCCGCLYTAAMHAAQLWSFPILFLEQGAVLGNSQTAIWLWRFWHVGLSSAILLYVISERLWPGYVVTRPRRTANLFWAVLIMLIAASIASVTVLHDRMQGLLFDTGFSFFITAAIAPAIPVVNAIALLLLWRLTRFRHTLHVWLGVALTALLFDNVITMIGDGFLSIGWYAGRVNALISGSVILLLYLIEINRVYLKTVHNANRLATSNALLNVKVDQARMDHLTNLPGRELFIERVTARHTLNQGNGTIVAILFIDLDGFKRINDTFGHERGDLVLIQTADVLRAVLRDTDIAARIGGDEFVVCLFAPFSAIQETMIDIAGRIVKMVSAIGDGIGCSIGVSLSSADNLNIETALHKADQAMYEAKKSGKNSFVIFGQPLLRKLHSYKKYVSGKF